MVNAGGLILPVLRERLLSRLQLMDENRDFMMMVLTHTHSLNFEEALIPAEALSSSDHPALCEVHTLFQQAKKNGELRDDATIESAYKGYVVMRNLLLHSWVQSPDQQSLLNDANTMLDVFLRHFKITIKTESPNKAVRGIF